MVSQLRLRELLNYDPITGKFTWIGRKHLNGKEAGCIDTHGYRMLTLDNVKYRGARVAWLYMTGEWPENHVDHVNGDTTDDSWANLRSASRSENMRNTKLRVDNTSGSRGVSFNQRSQKWHARVNVHGKLYHCGYFNSKEDAIIARDKRAAELHGAFARFDTITLNETRVV